MSSSATTTAATARLTVCYDLEVLAAATEKKNKITRLSEEIQVFDSKLGKIQTLLQDDLKVYDRICEVRDALFRLESQMHGCEVAEFCCSGLDEVVYQKTLNDMFWDQAKQHLYDNERDETLQGEDDD